MPRMRLRTALRRITAEMLDAKSMAAGLLLAPDLPEKRRDVVVRLDRRVRRCMDDLGAITDNLAEPDAIMQLPLPYAFGV